MHSVCLTVVLFCEFYFNVYLFLCDLQAHVSVGLIMLPSDIVFGDILREYSVDMRHFDFVQVF